MPDQRASVPLSQRQGMGQRDSSTVGRDSERDTGGTVGLKTLAVRALRRDTKRDSCGTVAEKSVPRADSVVGHRGTVGIEEISPYQERLSEALNRVCKEDYLPGTLR